MKLLGTDVAPLGMGCWAIGGELYAGDEPHGFANIDDAESTRTVHAAIDAGIRVFDTAAVYGAGHSERILGAALKQHSDTIIISKLGTSFDEKTRKIIADDTNSANVGAAIDASLDRLQRDHVDVMLLHLNALPIETAEPIFEEMEKARQAGKLRSYGWSTDFPASATAMASMEGFIGIEHAMNLFVDVPSVQATVEKLNLTAFIRSPLAMGVLTGKFDAQSKMPSNDNRSTNSGRRDYFSDGKVTPKHLKKLDAIRELLQTGGRTLAQGALGWLLTKSDRNLPLPGARTVAQMQENAGALSFGPLPETVMEEIETLIDREPEGEPRKR